MFKIILTLSAILGAASAVSAENVPITGTVESKCSVVTEIQGVYGTPNPYKLSTTPSDGGVLPKIRFDTTQAGYYLARITTPTSFSSSPTLSDTVVWTGSTTVESMSSSDMSGYQGAKVTSGNTTDYNLTVAGSVWINVSSTAVYGVDTSMPAGEYTAIVVAECIAK